MNQDEKFQQRWEYRRLEVDGDSSIDGSRSISSGNPTVKKHKLTENDETIDTPICQWGYKLEEKKIKKKKPKVDSKDMVISKDLKIFGDLLIDELKVARENMLAHMRQEMKKLVDLRSKLVKKNVGPGKRVEACVKFRDCPRGSSDASTFSKATNGLHKGERSGPSTKTRTISAVDSDRMVSSSYLTLPPTVLQNPQFQNRKNPIPHLNYHQFQALQADQQFGSFSCKSVGSKPNIGFHRVLDSNSNMSYTENSFLNNSKVVPMMNGVRFHNSISSNIMAYRSDEEYVSQLARTQRWPVLRTNFRNE